jgi:hypothetical protein
LMWNEWTTLSIHGTMMFLSKRTNPTG